MNPRPTGCCPYAPTKAEHYANVLTHGAVILPSVYGCIYLNSYAKTHEQSTSVLIYGISLILLFTVSTLFHLFSMLESLRRTYWRKLFHYFDRATIYVFIASSYTPWLYLRTTNDAHLLGRYMFYVVWAAAALGIAYQVIFHEKYKLLEIVFYLAIGFCPSIVIIEMQDTSGLFELAVGGAFYAFGVLFFKADGIVPFAHAIWHLFVSLGACVHYYAIFTYLIHPL